MNDDDDYEERFRLMSPAGIEQAFYSLTPLPTWHRDKTKHLGRFLHLLQQF